MIAHSEFADQGAALTSLINIELHALPADEAARLLEVVPFERFLDYAFAVLLNRSVDPIGKRHYRALADGGKSRRAIVGDLLKSEEFIARYGARQQAAQPLDDFVNQVYQDVLGRWADAEGLNTYRIVAARRGGRRRVIANVLLSPEAQRRGGGRYGRITSLRVFARRELLLRLPLVGRWLRSRDEAEIRLERIELGQQELARRLGALQMQDKTLASADIAGDGAIAPLDADGRADQAVLDDWTYRTALRRARHDAMLGS